MSEITSSDIALAKFVADRDAPLMRRAFHAVEMDPQETASDPLPDA